MGNNNESYPPQLPFATRENRRSFTTRSGLAGKLVYCMQKWFSCQVRTQF